MAQVKTLIPELLPVHSLYVFLIESTRKWTRKAQEPVHLVVSMFLNKITL